MMEQNPYEEGSVLMDAEEHFEYDTMEELAELAERAIAMKFGIRSKFKYCYNFSKCRDQVYTVPSGA